MRRKNTLRGYQVNNTDREHSGHKNRVIDGERVRVLRERAFFSRSELASLAGLDRSTVGRIEEGPTVVHPRTIRRLAEALSVEPSSLASSGSGQEIS
jgi:transcriptional regulator with XRE-family HTH domain